MLTQPMDTLIIFFAGGIMGVVFSGLVYILAPVLLKSGGKLRGLFLSSKSSPTISTTWPKSSETTPINSQVSVVLQILLLMNTLNGLLKRDRNL